MRRSFVQSVLSSQKQRQRYYYFKNITAGLCGIATFVGLGGVFGIALGVAATVLAYFTVAPIVAFLICLFEQMAS